MVSTKTEFCKLMGIHVQILSDIKNCKRGVTIEMLSNLFKLFNISPIYIIEGLGPQFIEHSSLVSDNVGEKKSKVSARKSIEDLEKTLKKAVDAIEQLKSNV